MSVVTTVVLIRGGVRVRGCNGVARRNSLRGCNGEVVGLGARTHKIANGDIDPTSASAHFADSSRTSPEVREVPEADICSRSKLHFMSPPIASRRASLSN